MDTILIGEPPMAQAERKEFSDRLNKALKEAGYRSSPTELANLFNVRYTGHAVTVHAARKWLVGESIPTQDKLRVLAEMLDVSAVWLRFGEAEEKSDAKPTAESRMSPGDARVLADLQSLDATAQRIARDFIRMLSRTHRAA